MSEIAEAIQQLPGKSWVPILVIIAIGVVLWAAGGRLLRTAFALLGFLIGAAVGWLLGHAVELGAPAGLVALIAALVVACVATLAFRAAVATGLAAIVAVAAPMSIWAVADIKGLESAVSEPLASPEPSVEAPAEPEMDEIDRWLAEVRGDTIEEAGVELEAEVAETIAAAKTLIEHVVDQFQVVWDRVPEDLRSRMLGATIVGGLIGFLVGTLATAFSASLVTAFAGSMTWLVGGWSALSKAGVDGPWVPTGPAGWMVLWLAVGIIGLAVQWTVRVKAADKPA